jgi:hypothetical protein
VQVHDDACRGISDVIAVYVVCVAGQSDCSCWRLPVEQQHWRAMWGMHGVGATREDVVPRRICWQCVLYMQHGRCLPAMQVQRTTLGGFVSVTQRDERRVHVWCSVSGTTRRSGRTDCPSCHQWCWCRGRQAVCARRCGPGGKRDGFSLSMSWHLFWEKMQKESDLYHWDDFEKI